MQPDPSELWVRGLGNLCFPERLVAMRTTHSLDAINLPNQPPRLLVTYLIKDRKEKKKPPFRFRFPLKVDRRPPVLN